jgi:hypothetical protein
MTNRLADRCLIGRIGGGAVGRCGLGILRDGGDDTIVAKVLASNAARKNDMFKPQSRVSGTVC